MPTQTFKMLTSCVAGKQWTADLQHALYTEKTLKGSGAGKLQVIIAMENLSVPLQKKTVPVSIVKYLKLRALPLLRK